MSDIDVSVIVPCYNVERYLDEALSSIERNDRCGLEILVVNDGSTDGSLEIMRAHEARDSRVRVIDKANQGYGATVNRGIDEARGAYVAILEPDDWVEPHMYDDLYEYAASFEAAYGLPDIVKSAYWRIYLPETPDEQKLRCSYYKRIDPPQQPFTLAEEPRLVWHHPSIWSALYRKGFLSDKNIRFKELPGAGWVDNPFLFETMCQADTIVYTDNCYYCYREDLPGSSSATRVLELSFERWHDMADVCDRLGIDDFGIRRSLTVIGFRYVGEAVGRGALDDPSLEPMIKSIFERMDPDVIVSLTNVSPELRALAFTMCDRPVPHMSKAAYMKALADEFVYSVRVNGWRFAIERTGIYRERRERQDKESARHSA